MMNQFGSGVSSAVNHLRATTNQWHHPHISRAEGAQLLEGCEAGSFILRESSKGGSYALSMILPNSGALGHYLVEKRGPECFCLQGSENSFCTIEELLAHYHHHDSIGLPCRLRLPQRHSSSMSYPARPTLPPLPPRNNSRASSVSRPSFNRPKVPGGNPHAAAAAAAAAVAGNKMGPAKPHLDPRRPFEDGSHGAHGGFSPPQPIPHANHGQHPTHGGHPVPHPHASHSPLQAHGLSPRPSTAPPLSPIMPGGSLSHTMGSHDDEGGETYEDMAAGQHRLSATPHAHGMMAAPVADDECGETYEDMASGRLSGGVGAPPPRVANEDEFGETYEDMASSRLSGGVGAPPPHVANEDEFGETYEDMAAGKLGIQQLGASSVAVHDDEFGETYEDMASGLRQAQAVAPDDEGGETYEDMSVMQRT